MSMFKKERKDSASCHAKSSQAAIETNQRTDVHSEEKTVSTKQSDSQCKIRIIKH